MITQNVPELLALIAPRGLRGANLLGETANSPVPLAKQNPLEQLIRKSFDKLLQLLTKAMRSRGGAGRGVETTGGHAKVSARRG